MKKPNYEDFIMKRAMDIFVDEGLRCILRRYKKFY